ncbi:MAG: hypothetical protein AAFU65_18185 [Pseudomonadota bacterium]
MYLQYTPTQSLHNGGTGAIEVDLANELPRRNVEGAQFVSNDGTAVETALFRKERRLEIKAGPVPLADEGLWREFEDSVDDGAAFTLDLYGSQAVPDNPVSVVMVLGSFREERLGSLYRYYSFNVLTL